MAKLVKSISGHFRRKKNVGTQATLLTSETASDYVSEFFFKMRAVNGDGNAEIFKGDMKMDLEELVSFYTSLGERLAKARTQVIEKTPRLNELKLEADVVQKSVTKCNKKADKGTRENEEFEDEREREKQQIADLRNERDTFDGMVLKLREDLHLCEDNGFEFEENLANLKETRKEIKRLHEEEIPVLHEAANTSEAKKMIYTDIKEFKDYLKTSSDLVSKRQELEEVRREHDRVTAMLKEQAQEREFLLERNGQILQKIVGLQKQIEDKENICLPIDHAYQTDAIITPTTWCQAPGSTPDEVTECLQKEFQENKLKYVESYERIAIALEDDSESSSDSRGSCSGSDDGDPVSNYQIN